MKRYALLTLAILLIPTTALADTATKTAVVTGLASTVLNILLPVLSLLAAYLAKKLINAIEARTGVQLSADNYNKLMEQIDLGVHYAAEQAEKAGDKGLAGNEKLAIASKYVNDAITHFGLNTIAENNLKALIEAKLNAKKATGATV